jgi:SDR family mycofactocin-dependent oxidoreductase
MAPDSSQVSRVALVTGAGRGIGAATVRALADSGYGVVAVDSCAGGEHGLAGVDYPLAVPPNLEQFGRYDDRVLAVRADARDPQALGAAVRQALDRWGRLDAVVAAAAVISGGNLQWETPVAELDALWDVDLKGVWHTAAATIPHLLAQPDPSGCRFVAVASTAGSEGLFHLSAYTVVKHAVVGLVRALAADLVGTGVTAAGVAPAATDTRMLAATAAIYGLDDVAELAPGGRVLEPAEVAATVAFCCSREGGVVNGTVVRCGG